MDLKSLSRTLKGAVAVCILAAICLTGNGKSAAVPYHDEASPDGFRPAFR